MLIAGAQTSEPVNCASFVFAMSELQTFFLWPLQAHRNLSQLPNFAFSVPLAYFLLSQQADLPEQELSSAREQASVLIRQALTMFPGGGCSLASARTHVRTVRKLTELSWGFRISVLILTV